MERDTWHTILQQSQAPYKPLKHIGYRISSVLSDNFFEHPATYFARGSANNEIASTNKRSFLQSVPLSFSLSTSDV